MKFQHVTLSLLLLAACGGSGTDANSSRHQLQPCAADSDCAAGDSCVRGYCESPPPPPSPSPTLTPTPTPTPSPSPTPPPPPPSSCDAVLQDCGAGFACAPVNDGLAQCVSAGSGGAGSSCVDGADCAAGFGCVAFAGSSPGVGDGELWTFFADYIARGGGTCKALCAAGGTCAGAGELCESTLNSTYGVRTDVGVCDPARACAVDADCRSYETCVSGACIYLTPTPPPPPASCDALAQDCAVGLSCAPLDGAPSTCITPGSAAAGASCADSSDCAAGLACAELVGSSRGQNIHTFAVGRGTGVCRELCAPRAGSCARGTCSPAADAAAGGYRGDVWVCD